MPSSTGLERPPESVFHLCSEVFFFFFLSFFVFFGEIPYPAWCLLFCVHVLTCCLKWCAFIRFMMVLASNQPDQFDWAINDRLDELIPFALPEVDERFRMLKLYFRLYVMAPPRISWWKKPK